MGGILASIGGWLLGGILKRSPLEWVGKAIEGLTGSSDGAVRLEEIRARTTETLAAEQTEHRRIAADFEKARMNWPVFWVIVCVMIGAPATLLWSVTLYNILWWDQGIWPQGWAIAAYPPSVAPWVEKSIDWLYSPMGVPGTVGSAWLAGRLGGSR